MPLRRSFLGTLCSGALVLSGCGYRESDEYGASSDEPVATDDAAEETVTPTPTPPDRNSDDTESNTSDTDSDSDQSSDEEPLDIRDFGATIDGKTDDTHAVRAAVRSAEAGDTILFPAGTTFVSPAKVEERSAIILDRNEIPPNLTLAGRGRGSVIRMEGTDILSPSVITLVGKGSFGGLEIRDLRIDGNRSEQLVEGGHGIRSGREPDEPIPADVRIRNVWVENCNQTGISLRHGGVLLDRCTVQDCTKHGISLGLSDHITGNPPRVVVRRSYCTRNGKAGAGVTYGINCSAGNILVEDCVCENNAQGTKTTAAGVEVRYRRVRLANNDIWGYIRAGGDTTDRTHVVFEDVVAVGNEGGGVRLSRDTDYSVPTELLASENMGTNVRVANDARITGERIWSNRAKGAYGISAESAATGRIEYYHPYLNETGPVNGDGDIQLVHVDEADKTDIDGVPTARDVGAGTEPPDDESLEPI